MYDHILLPVDGGDGVGAAVEQAAGLARENDATLHVLYVVDRMEGGTGLLGANRADTFPALREEGERVTEEVADCCRRRGIDVVSRVEKGSPHRVIVDYADEIDADVLVMGSRRRRGVSRFLLGSVTEHVTRNTSRPVLVVDHEGDLPTGDTGPEPAVEG